MKLTFINNLLASLGWNVLVLVLVLFVVSLIAFGLSCLLCMFKSSKLPRGVLLLFAALLIAVAATTPVYFLWNWVAVTVLSLKVITFGQAFGLSWLSSILFKSYNSSKK